MTKKKGFFSKIKSKLSKDQDDADFVDAEIESTDEEYEDEEYEEEEEYEDEYEDVDSVNADSHTPPIPVVEDPTLEVYIDELSSEDSDEDKGFLNKIKSKLTKKSNIDDEDSEEDDFDDELEDDDSDEQEVDESEKYNVMQRMLNRIKDKAQDIDLSRGIPKKSKGQSSGVQYLLPNLLSSESRPKIHQYFIILLACVFLYQIGKVAALFLNKKDNVSNIQTNFSRPRTFDYNEPIANIRNYNPFNIQEDENDKPQEVKKPKNVVKVCKEATIESRLGLKLENTIVLQNSMKSVASIKNRNKVLNIRIGSKIDNMAEIGNITRQRVVFKNLRSGECEFIANVDNKSKRFERKAKTKVHPPSAAKTLMPEFNKDIAVEGNNFKIKKQLRDQLLSNIGDVLTQAKAITIKNPDGTLCFKMTEVKAGSIYSYLNVQNDDVICEINGSSINNINQIMGMFGNIKSTDYYQLGIKRGGVQQSYNYNFVD